MKFSCTSKILKTIKDKTIYSSEIDDEFNWYVDLMKLRRKRYFLFTHENTLFSFLAYMGTKKHLDEFSIHFQHKLIEQIIKIYGFNEVAINELDKHFKKVFYCKTANRSVLGSMNDFKINIKSRIEKDGNSDEVINSINHYLNIMPMGMLNYQSPLEVFRQRINL